MQIIHIRDIITARAVIKLKGLIYMTELEKIERAKMYIDKLANGIDPLTDLEMTDNRTLNNVRISRCFFFVSEILRQVIDNGGEIASKGRKTRGKFTITYEELQGVQTTEELIPISILVNKINEIASVDNMRKLNATKVTNWLLEKNFLEIFESGGKKRRLPSKLGNSIGMSYESRMGQYGEFLVVLYDKNAQQFIIDNLIGILDDC